MQQNVAYPQADVLHSFAAPSVLVLHVVAHVDWTAFPRSGPRLWFRFSWMGVDLFLSFPALLLLFPPLP